jgi:hypothetical protein
VELSQWLWRFAIGCREEEIDWHGDCWRALSGLAAKRHGTNLATATNLHSSKRGLSDWHLQHKGTRVVCDASHNIESPGCTRDGDRSVIEGAGRSDGVEKGREAIIRCRH